MPDPDIPLDFPATASIAWLIAEGRQMMTPELADETARTCLRSMSLCLAQAVSLAKAAEGCMQDGNRSGAIGIALDVEELLAEANSLLNVATFVHRQVRP